MGTLKQQLKITQRKGNLNSRVHSFLLQYRCAGIHSGLSPAERLLGYKRNMPSMLANSGEPILYERFLADNRSVFEPGVCSW